MGSTSNVIKRLQHSPFMPVTAALSAMFFIQAGASIIKGLFALVGTQGATTLRLAFASLMMLAIWRPWRTPVRPGSWRWIIAYGIALGAMNSLFYHSLSRIPLGIAVAIEFTGPLGLALLSSRRPLDFLWVLLAIAGICLLLPISPGSEALDPVGVACAFGAGLFWAFYIVFGQRAGGGGGSGPAVVYGSIIGTVAVLPFGAMQAVQGVMAPHVLPAVLAVALLSSAIPYSLEMVAMTRLPAKIFGVLMSVEPGIGALVGFLLLHEHMSVAQVLAVLMIIAASAGTVLTHSAERASPTAQSAAGN
jgi:inner membrane transporter RhtA